MIRSNAYIGWLHCLFQSRQARKMLEEIAYPPTEIEVRGTAGEPNQVLLFWRFDCQKSPMFTMEMRITLSNGHLCPEYREWYEGTKGRKIGFSGLAFSKQNHDHFRINVAQMIMEGASLLPPNEANWLYMLKGKLEEGCWPRHV